MDLSGEAELETLCDRAADAGLAPYGTRLTTRDLEQLGFEAVRVVCPSAQPLFFGESFRRAGRNLPADLGFARDLTGITTRSPSRTSGCQTPNVARSISREPGPRPTAGRR